MTHTQSRILLAGAILAIVWCVVGVECLANNGPRSEKLYRLALVQAQVRMTATPATGVFTRTGRMDRQDVRYNGAGCQTSN